MLPRLVSFIHSAKRQVRQENHASCSHVLQRQCYHAVAIYHYYYVRLHQMPQLPIAATIL